MTARSMFVIAAATIGLCGAAAAQDAVDVAAAKKEGKLVWYTSTPINIGQKIVDASYACERSTIVPDGTPAVCADGCG